MTLRAVIDYRSTWMPWMRRGFFVMIMLFLAYRLTDIGWEVTIKAFPTSPLFYLLSVFIFLVVPASEVLNYRLITGAYIPDGLKVFSRKRVYNEALFSYSGEAYLCNKLSSLSGFDFRSALGAVKDNNLISIIVSNIWVMILATAVLFYGRSDVIVSIYSVAPALVGSFVVIAVLFIGLAAVFFRKISRLALDTLIKVAMVHTSKVLVIAALQVAQWASAIPAAAASTWLLLLTVQTLIKRIPGLPNSDLVFLSVGLSLAGFAAVDSEQLTAMLVAATATTFLVQLCVFGLTSRVKAYSHPPGA